MRNHILFTVCLLNISSVIKGFLGVVKPRWWYYMLKWTYSALSCSRLLPHPLPAIVLLISSYETNPFHHCFEIEKFETQNQFTGIPIKSNICSVIMLNQTKSQLIKL